MKKFDIIGAPFNRLGHIATDNNTVDPIRVSDKNRWNGLTEWMNIRNNNWSGDIIDKGDVLPDLEVINRVKSGQDLLALQLYTKQIKEEILETLSSGRIPITIGGDHSIAVGTISAIMEHYKKNQKKRVAIIWIDAHGDCNDNIKYNLHGTPLAILMNKLKGWQLDKDKAVCPEDIFYIGLRDVMPNELNIIKSNNIKNYSIDIIDNLGINRVVSEVMKIVNDNYDKLYISFDYDSLDGSIFRACATPNVGGLSAREVLHTVYELTKNDNFIGMDLCEYLPELDRDRVSKELIVKIIDTAWGYRI